MKRIAPPFVLVATAATLAALANTACQNPPHPASAPVTHRQPTQPRPLPQPVRAVWVARMHYKTPDDIRTIMHNSAAMGFNTVLWQVRGNGTVMYPSQLEPWAGEYDFRDPGFDPLALAVQEAHRNGLRIEAWINVMPGWRGPKPPPMPNQLWNAHPDWFLRDAGGRRQPLDKFYLILNPANPAARDHIARVAGEIVGRYPVDGLHLDYIRYAWDTTPGARDRYPRDPQTLERYARETGLAPDDDPAAWDAWRANQLTRLVAQIRETAQRTRPGTTLTAATWSSPTRGYREYFQDAVGWLRSGLLDATYVMAYTDRVEKLEAYIGEYHQLAPRRRVIPGLGIYKLKTGAELTDQLARCRAWGGDFAIFSYASLRAVAGDRGRKPAALKRDNALRAVRRDALARFLAQQVARTTPR